MPLWRASSRRRVHVTVLLSSVLVCDMFVCRMNISDVIINQWLIISCIALYSISLPTTASLREEFAKRQNKMPVGEARGKEIAEQLLEAAYYLFKYDIILG